MEKSYYLKKITSATCAERMERAVSKNLRVKKVTTTFMSEKCN